MLNSVKEVWRKVRRYQKSNQNPWTEG